MDWQKILEELTSKDSTKIWSSSCAIIKYRHDRENIEKLIPHLSLIRKKTAGIDLGKGFADNKRFLDIAIEIIELYENGHCFCSLFTHGLFKEFDPKYEAKNNTVKIITEKTIPYESEFEVECLNCGQGFDIKERNGHFTWWDWEIIENYDVSPI